MRERDRNALIDRKSWPFARDHNARRAGSQRRSTRVSDITREPKRQQTHDGFPISFFFFFSHPPGKSRADEVADLGGGWRCFTWLRGWWTLSGE